MAVFEKEIPTKVVIDDTTPLLANIVSTQTVDNHIEYIIRVQRSPADHKWTVSRRYNDFARLHSHLSASKLPLHLPPKKLLGNMDRDFIAQRQSALQNYIDSILSSPLCNSLHVKKFLDPDQYDQPFDEQALQHVLMALRSDHRFELLKPFEEMGWRFRKHYFGARRSGGDGRGEQLILTWTCNGPDQFLDQRQLIKIMNAMGNLQHPHIEPSLLISVGESGAVVVRRLAMEGSLRDILYGTKPCESWIAKLAHAEPIRSFTQREIARIGAQILDTLCYLAEKGIHYGHLHPGNILVGEVGEVRLLDIEDGMLGLPCIYRPHLVHLRKVHSPESVDVYCFGRTLYEMALGHPLATPTIDCKDCDTYDCSPLMWSLLQSLLGSAACRKGLPTLSELRCHPFFAGIPRASTSGIVLQLSSQLRQALAASYSRAEARLQEDQKRIRQQKRHARVQQHLALEEEQQRRGLSGRPPRQMSSGETKIEKSTSSGTLPATLNGKSPERSDSPTSTNTSGGTLTPPPGYVASNVSDRARGGNSTDTEGLSALLGSICNFDKGSLRNTGGAR